MIHIYVAAGLAVVAALLGWLGHSKAKRTDLYGLYIDATRPSELGAGVPGFYGGQVTMVEGQPQLVAPYSKQPCVWYQYEVQQEDLRRDANGVETREWRTIENSPPSGVTFMLQAAGGTVYVNPANAQVDHAMQYESMLQSMDTQNMNGAMKVVGGLVNALSNNRQRVIERYIPVGQRLYAGGVALDQNGQKVFANDQSYPLVVTTQSKADLVKSGKRTSAIEYGVGMLLFAAAIVVALVVKK